MRDRLPVTAFDKGIVCGIDHEDVHQDASVYSEDVDVVCPTGVLRGRMGDVEAYGDQVDEGAFLSREDDWDLVFRQSTDLKAVKNFYGTQTVQSFTLPSGGVVSGGVVFARRGKALHLGCGDDNPPLWVGYTPWSHFGSADDGTLRCLLAECKGNAGTTSNGDWNFHTYPTEHTGTGFFKTDTLYFWKWCLVYDGYQRSPLVRADGASGYHTCIPDNESDYVDVTLKLVGGVSTLDPRITALELYRAERDFVGASGEPSEYYTLAATLDLTATVQNSDSDAEGWYRSADGSDTLFRYRDRGNVGYTYESQSGIPETLTSNIVKYGICAESLGYLFVGQCAQTNSPDASMMIFRSKVYRFDMFNWAEDYLLLPFAPTAMAGWGGKLYVFDGAQCVRIDPSTMQIEEALPGVGARGKRSVLPTEAGLFVFGTQNVYLIGSSGVRPIGEAIKTAQTSSLYTPVALNTLGTTITPTLGWDARGGLLVCAVNKTGAVYGLLVYVLMENRWEYWTLDGVARECVLSGRSGEVYVGLADTLLHVGGGSTRRTATWVSGVFTFGSAEQKKKVYKIKKSGTGTVTYAVDSGTTWNALDGDDLDSDHWLCNSVQCKVVVTAAQELRSLEVVYRRLEDLR